MERFEIWFGQANFRNCLDERPRLIVGPITDHVVGCFPIGSQCYHGDCFQIVNTSPDFPSTGLTKTCYVMYARTYDLPVSALRRRRGRMQGTMLQTFLEESGLT